jgi:signal peptidase I
MNLDQPWKIAALIGLLAFLRIVWGLWHSAPARKFMVELLDSGLIAFILVFVLIRPFVVQAFFIPSTSMVPTLLPGDRIIVNRFIYRLNPPRRGDIIVFNAPPQALQLGDGQKDFVKRLIGLPGDDVVVRAGKGVYVNGKLLPNPPGVPLPDYDWPEPEAAPYHVPEGYYIVLGDHRAGEPESYDSHLWRDPMTGRPMPALEADRVLGKALVTFWPPPRIGLVSDGQQPRSGRAAAAESR